MSNFSTIRLARAWGHVMVDVPLSCTPIQRNDSLHQNVSGSAPELAVEVRPSGSGRAMTFPRDLKLERALPDKPSSIGEESDDIRTPDVNATATPEKKKHLIPSHTSLMEKDHTRKGRSGTTRK